MTADEAKGAPPGAAEVVLDVEDIRVFYGNIEALKGVSLQIRAGEIVTL
ncbi:MAG TPA: ABC transporter ATP-binding protein, partial [Thermoleophilia bacterium]|nr:ABC transporter ATP-binding protein [Thermoleophilia bacterium]